MVRAYFDAAVHPFLYRPLGSGLESKEDVEILGPSWELSHSNTLLQQTLPREKACMAVIAQSSIRKC